MFIENSYLSNNIAFYGAAQKWVKRPGQILVEDMANITSLTEKYNKTRNFISKMNGPYLTDFRKLYTNLVTGKRAGLVFTNLVKTSPRIQIAKLNKNNNNELLTFVYMDNKNKAVRKYRIGKDGCVYSPAAEIKKQPPFDFSIVSNLLAEFDKLDIIVDNCNLFRKILRKNSENSSFLSLANEIQSGIITIKPEIDNLLNSFNSMHSHLQKRPNKALALKQEFLGESAHKYYSVKNAGSEVETYSFMPTHFAGDNRNSIIKIMDKNNKLRQVYVLYDNGEIKIPIDITCKELRPCNLKNLTNSNMEKQKIIQIIHLLEEKFNEFDAFINEKIKEQRTPKKITEVKRTPKQKTEKTNEIKNFELRIAQKQKEEKEKELKKAVAKKNAIIRAAQKKSEACKSEFTSIEIKNPEMLKKEYMNMNCESIAQVLGDIFSTPVDQRSSHLIHEKLPDGRIYNGRFSFNASDGAKITVSKKVSNRLWNYKYYSINIEKENLNYTVNLDYNTGQFLNSSKEGKVIINTLGTVSYIPKSVMQERNTHIINLPQYLKELCISDNTQARQIIDFSVKKSSDISITEQREKEVEQILQVLDKEDAEQL